MSYVQFSYEPARRPDGAGDGIRGPVDVDPALADVPYAGETARQTAWPPPAGYYTRLRRTLAGIEALIRPLRTQIDVVILVAAGASRNGPLALYSALQPLETSPRLIDIGHHLSAASLAEMRNAFGDACAAGRVMLYVVSQSGQTTEVVDAFHALQAWMVAAAGPEVARTRIVVASTAGSPLDRLAAAAGYGVLSLPQGMPGRFASVPAAALLPLALAGHDASALLAGAEAAAGDLAGASTARRQALRYAAIRRQLFAAGYRVETLVCYRPRLLPLLAWWQQLFVESESKNGHGLLPLPALYTADLHGLGQWLLHGPRIAFETTLQVVEDEPRIGAVCAGIRADHRRSGLPQLGIRVERLDPFTLGYLCAWLQQACVLGCRLAGVEPFSSPAVADFKQTLRRRNAAQANR